MKKFLIIGNANAITYKEVFPSIANGEIFVRTSKGTIHMGMWFHTNSGELKEAPSVWFTTLDSKHLYKTIELTKTYDPAKYPRYDNYDAIEVSCIKDIPKDYDGVMGVPISIVLFSPEQFKILDARNYALKEELKHKATYLVKDADGSINGKAKYARVFIEHSSEEPDIINGGVFNNPYVNGKQKYKRLLIKKRWVTILPDIPI